MTTTFATVNAAAASFSLHPTEADAAAAADTHDHLLVLIAEDLSELTMPQGAALFAATAVPLGIAPVKRFPDRATAARRIWANLVALAAAAAAPEAAVVPAPQPVAQTPANAQPKAQRRSRGIPGVVEGQHEFYHVSPDGAVSRWWLVPGSPSSPNTHNPGVTDYPLGVTPRPGWHDANGTPLPCDPREASQ